MAVRHVLRDDLGDLEDVLMQAFADDPHLEWLYPDHGAARRSWFGSRSRRGGDAGTPTARPIATGVAIWSPPGVNSLSRADGVALYEQMAESHGAAGTARLDTIAAARSTLHPTEPHFYLLTLGAATPGRGAGAELIAPVLRACDERAGPRTWSPPRRERVVLRADTASRPSMRSSWTAGLAPGHVAQSAALRERPVASAPMTVHERPFGRYLEDFAVGDVYRHWPGKTITEYDDHLFCMITMNHHPLHTNAWFAEHETVQGRNVVVGNLVYSLVLGMSVPDVSGAAIANLEVETLQHKHPTFHGDTIYAETRVLDVKESTSKADRGIVTVETKGFNQDGKEVCYFRRKVMVWKRELAPARQRPYDGRTVWELTAEPAVDEHDRRSLLEWADAASARPAVAPHPRPVGDPGGGGDAPADPGGAGRARATWTFLERSRRRPRARRRRSATCCAAVEGLGYNRRAVSLHAAAGAVDRRLGGALPATLAGCSRCPASGRTRRGRCMAFAFEADVAVVDTNVARVLARGRAARCGPARSRRSPTPRCRRARAWVWNQAMLDLGATVCRARRRVRALPVAAVCACGRRPDARRPTRAGVGRSQPAAVALRRLRPPGSGSPRPALGRGPVARGDLAAVMGWPDDEARAGAGGGRRGGRRPRRAGAGRPVPPPLTVRSLVAATVVLRRRRGGDRRRGRGRLRGGGGGGGGGAGGGRRRRRDDDERVELCVQG